MEAPWVDDRGNARPAAPPCMSHEVSKFVGVLKRQWLLYDLSEDLPPTCWPFIIPKTSEKVSLVLSCGKQNGLDGCHPPPPRDVGRAPMQKSLALCSDCLHD